MITILHENSGTFLSSINDSIEISKFNMFNSDVSRMRIILEEWDEIYVEEKEGRDNRAIAPDQSNWMLMNDALTEFNDANLPDHLAPPKEPKTNWIGTMKKNPYQVEDASLNL